MLKINLINRHEDVSKFVDHIPSIPGYQDVVCHGTPYRCCRKRYTRNGVKWVIYDAARLAYRIRKHPYYTGGNIRLLSCSAGAADHGIAQKLADILQVNVMAPTGNVWVAPDGQYGISDDLSDPNRVQEWRIFYPAYA